MSHIFKTNTDLILLNHSVWIIVSLQRRLLWSVTQTHVTHCCLWSKTETLLGAFAIYNVLLKEAVVNAFHFPQIPLYFIFNVLEFFRTQVVGIPQGPRPNKLYLHINTVEWIFSRGHCCSALSSVFWNKSSTCLLRLCLPQHICMVCNGGDGVSSEEWVVPHFRDLPGNVYGVNSHLSVNGSKQIFLNPDRFSGE